MHPGLETSFKKDEKRRFPSQGIYRESKVPVTRVFAKLRLALLSAHRRTVWQTTAFARIRRELPAYRDTPSSTGTGLPATP